MNEQQKTKEIHDLFESFPEEWKEELPVAFYGAKSNPTKTGLLLTERSDPYNTSQLACYWFHKPITQTHKSFLP